LKIAAGPKEDISSKKLETFEKCSILVKVKEGENFNHRNMLNISSPAEKRDEI